jgi:hypothetical protein
MDTLASVDTDTQEPVDTTPVKKEKKPPSSSV